VIEILRNFELLGEARPYRFESHVDDRAHIRDGSIAMLRTLPYLPSPVLDVRLDRQRTIDPHD
jgi:hypothetical protein